MFLLLIPTHFLSEEIFSRVFRLSPESVVAYVELGGKRKNMQKFTDQNQGCLPKYA